MDKEWILIKPLIPKIDLQGLHATPKVAVLNAKMGSQMTLEEFAEGVSRCLSSLTFVPHHGWGSYDKTASEDASDPQIRMARSFPLAQG
jgi:hypothetical protein